MEANLSVVETGDLKRSELEAIDRRLEQLPMGQIVVRRTRGEERAWRLWKEGAQDRFELLGPIGGAEHRRFESMLLERRDLSRRRRILARDLL